MEEINVRIRAINRKIAFFRQHILSADCSLNEKDLENSEPGRIVDPELQTVLGSETKLPLYISPSDFIDEFGRIKTTSSTTTQSQSETQANEDPVAIRERIIAYMKKRFPERLQQCKSLASLSHQVYTAWRSRTRRREAEWGDPDNLGLPSEKAHTSATFYGPGTAVNTMGGRGGWRNALAKHLPDQQGVEPKTLLPSFFIPCPLAIGNRLYHSTEPTTTPSTVTVASSFTANMAIWSPSEKKTFIELYLQHPKNFGRIAAHLPFKSSEQCVEFYYRNKKEFKLKQMVVSYRRAMVAQRKMILNTTTTTITTTQQQQQVYPLHVTTNNIVVDDDNSAGSSNNINSTNSNNTNNNNNSNSNNNSSTVSLNSSDPSASGSIGSSRKRTGRPVGRPKNKDRPVKD